MFITKNLVKIAFNESQKFGRKLLQTKKERIDSAKNHSLYMN